MGGWKWLTSISDAGSLTCTSHSFFRFYRTWQTSWDRILVPWHLAGQCRFVVIDFEQQMDWIEVKMKRTETFKRKAKRMSATKKQIQNIFISGNVFFSHRPSEVPLHLNTLDLITLDWRIISFFGLSSGWKNNEWRASITGTIFKLCRYLLKRSIIFSPTQAVIRFGEKCRQKLMHYQCRIIGRESQSTLFFPRGCEPQGQRSNVRRSRQGGFTAHQTSCQH